MSCWNVGCWNDSKTRTIMLWCVCSCSQSGHRREACYSGQVICQRRKRACNHRPINGNRETMIKYLPTYLPISLSIYIYIYTYNNTHNNKQYIILYYVIWFALCYNIGYDDNVEGVARCHKVLYYVILYYMNCISGLDGFVQRTCRLSWGDRSEWREHW